jgi:hypothetical protein
MSVSTLQQQRDEAVHAWLLAHPGATAREIAVGVFGEVEGLTGRTKAYMIGYHTLIDLEGVGAVRRERFDGLDRWTAVEGAHLPERQVRGRPPSGKMPRRLQSLIPWVVVHLTEAQHLTLIGVLNDACADDPLDIELRELRATVRGAAAKHIPINRAAIPRSPTCDDAAAE